jgi:hypothetical protein
MILYPLKLFGRLGIYFYPSYFMAVFSKGNSINEKAESTPLILILQGSGISSFREEIFRGFVKPINNLRF